MRSGHAENRLCGKGAREKLNVRKKKMVTRENGGVEGDGVKRGGTWEQLGGDEEVLRRRLVGALHDLTSACGGETKGDKGQQETTKDTKGGKRIGWREMRWCESTGRVEGRKEMAWQHWQGRQEPGRRRGAR